MITLFAQFSDGYAKFHNPFEHLSVDEVTVTFKQYIPKKHEHFGIKIYKLYNMTGYTYNMRIYLG
jgi:hypothetical protein